MKISNRLRVIGDLIHDNSFILDIGCDHALLDIYVVSKNKNVFAIASDINEGPLKGAKDNICKYGVRDKIKLKLGNGLESYEDGVDTLVLSGLGSTTIVEILEKDIEVLEKIKKIIVSSNNDYYFLRKSICNLGFKITIERIVHEKGKYYPIIVFEKGSEKYNYFELKYGPILLKNKDKVFLEYLNYNKMKLIKIYSSLKFKHLIRKIKIKKEIKFIERV